MSTVKRIVKNATVLLIAQASSYLLGFFYIMYTARYLGAVGFGILSFALAFTALFGVFTDLGLSPLTVREVARDKSLTPKYLANISVMKIILVAITFGLIALTINLMGYPQQTITVVYLVGLSIIFMAFTQMFYSIFQAFERMEYQSLGQVLNATLMLAGVIFTIKYGFSVIGFASLYAIASIVTLVYSFIVMKLKFSNPSSVGAAIEFDWRFWKPTIKQALPFGLTTIFTMIYYYIDSVMLSLMKGDEVVGWYNVAYRLILLPLFITAVFNSVIFPVMSRLSISSKSSLEFAYQRYFKYMVLLSIPIGVGTTLLADRFIFFVFGQEYAPAIIALQILIWSSVFIFINGTFGRLIESVNKQILATKVAGIGAVLNVVLNLLLIPKYGYIAASATTVVTEFTVLVLLGIICFKLGYGISLNEIMKNIGKAIVASIVMGIFIWYFISLNPIGLIALSVLIYFVCIGIFRVFDKEDINLAKQAVAGFMGSRK